MEHAEREVEVMRDLLKKYQLAWIGAIVGAGGGLLYWYLYGCEQGCTITSSPTISTLYFGISGALFFSAFSKPKPKNHE